ncbi:hypothetical protein ACFP7A_11605 [Sporolactobacillus kofuensis]|uniref:Uncharacterized protein n=1 Tax=Sporolactobacillus kofuensis TaxID=269672 RepID=A0ABW1WHV9_9BACL|nr:hypothetical protein [Sporolactobacillus kofuensis]
MAKKELSSEEKRKRVRLMLIIGVICAIDVIATLIYYYTSGAFKF